ncbi:glycine zipper 2TM domain-containing protein [Comamonas sp. JUb58]|uniref:glycine zipper 2TM domain-containing protein n=1 Tax=Comamonas sp. JUb58 TaxID=2485114 RepID=UPI001061CA0B|nr:glycine zipper 2TM domain-containing protein [Comamonas sp. JUb58]TDS83534.1 outer membrane lipoprotein SlyB [Comamonas sp. JUb58]
MSQTNPSSRSLLQRAGKLGLALAATSVLAACVQAPPRYDNRYPQGPAPQQQGSYPQQQAPYGMEYGTVGNIEELRSQSRSTSGVGAILGAVVGGVLGNQVGGGFGRMAATAAGVAGGAAAGNALEQSSNSGRSTVSGYRIHINLQNGGQRIFDVPNPGDLRPGDRVQINQGQISRY